MLVIPDKYIYVTTPRSGSRSVMKAFKHNKQVIRSRAHHNPVPNVAEAKEQYQLPVITLLRDPAHILLSYWWPSPKTGNRTYGGFSKWIKGRRDNQILWSRVYPYWELTDEYFPFARGLAAFFAHLGYPDLEVPTAGLRGLDPRSTDTRPDPSYIAPRHRKLIQEIYPDDVAIWVKESGEEWSISP